MDDSQIIDLFWQRSEDAIRATDSKYGSYCRAIAGNILHSAEEAEECTNDAYFKLWRQIPPERPNKLKYFLARIVRNLSLNRYEYRHAAKRSDGVVDICDEFIECIPDVGVDIADNLQLKEAINGFLASLRSDVRVVFLRRYWYACSIKDISRSLGLNESNVKIMLHRTRMHFRNYLEKEGIFI